MEKEDKEDLKESIKLQIQLAIIEHENQKHNTNNSLSAGYKILLIVSACLGAIATLISIFNSLMGGR